MLAAPKVGLHAPQERQERIDRVFKERCCLAISLVCILALAIPLVKCFVSGLFAFVAIAVFLAVDRVMHWWSGDVKPFRFHDVKRTRTDHQTLARHILHCATKRNPGRTRERVGKTPESDKQSSASTNSATLAPARRIIHARPGRSALVVTADVLHRAIGVQAF